MPSLTYLNISVAQLHTYVRRRDDRESIERIRRPATITWTRFRNGL